MNEPQAAAGKPVSSLRQRVLTAVLLAPLVLCAILFLPTRLFAALLGLIFLAGLWEWTRMIGFRKRRLRIIVVMVNAAAMVALLLLLPRSAWIWLVYVGVLWWFLALLWLKAFSFAEQPTSRNLEIKVLVGSLIILPAWGAGVLLHGLPQWGPQWTLFVVLLIWVADVCAYFAGRSFGNRKLAPRISPGKTREGVYGALLGCALYAGVAAWLWLPVAPGAQALFVALCLLTVVFSIVGDLFESLIKRHANMKDSGTLLPGHGGVLDRVDSMLAALPIFLAGHVLLQLQ